MGGEGKSPLDEHGGAEGAVGTANLVEIFSSIQGEGPDVGAATLFVRFGGCDLRCRWCDSAHTWKPAAECRIETARGAGQWRTRPNPLPVTEVVAAAEVVRDRMHFFFAVDTLEFLHRGGRIGGAKRLLGTALKIKPLLHFRDGQIEPLAQVRTKRKAIARMLEIAEERLDGRPMAEVAVPDVDTPEEGDAVAEQVKERFGVSTVYRSTVSPVVGTHAGPGTVGLAFYAEL